MPPTTEWVSDDIRGAGGQPVPPSVLAQLRSYRISSRRSGRRHLLVELAGLVVGAAIPALAAFRADARVIAVFGSVAVLIGGVRVLAGSKEIWTSRTRARYEIEKEIALFAVQHSPYDGDDAAGNLVEAVEGIVASDREGWVALRLSYDSTGAAPQSQGSTTHRPGARGSGS